MIVNTPNIFKINRLVKTIKISNIFSFPLAARCLWLAACNFLRNFTKKFFAFFYIRSRQVRVVHCEPRDQIIVFNSLPHTSSPARPDPVYGTRAIGRCNVRTASRRSTSGNYIILYQASLDSLLVDPHTGIDWQPSVYLYLFDPLI